MQKYQLGERSLREMETIHPVLKQLIQLTIRKTGVDFGILEGHRNKEKQDLAFNTGKSKVKFPDGKHNKLPSLAFDFGAYVNGKYTDSPQYYYYLAGVFKACAYDLKISIRWGGDWDSDGDFKDNSFNDLGHIELV